MSRSEETLLGSRLWRGGPDGVATKWREVGAAGEPDYEGTATGTVRFARDSAGETELDGEATGMAFGATIFFLPTSYYDYLLEDKIRPGWLTSSGEIVATRISATTGAVSVEEIATGGTVAGDLAAHLADATDAHDASAISVDSATLVGTGTNVQAVLEEMDDAIAASDVSAHIADTTDAHDATAISILDTGGYYSFAHVEGALQEAAVATANHLADVSDAHDASAISAVSTTLVGTATDVQGVLEELDNGIANHLADTSAAHAASAISADSTTLVGTGTDVQAVLEELDNAVAAAQPLDSDLTAIAGLSPSNDDIVQRKAGAWTNRTLAQVITDLAALGTTFQPLDSDLSSIAALSTTAFGRGLLALADAAALSASLPGYSNYTPTWTATGTAPNIGNATVVARYVQIGKLVHAQVKILFGSSSTFGTGNYRFAIPVTAASAADLAGSAWMLDDDTTNALQPIPSFISTTTIQFFYPATYLGALAVVGQTAPWTWAQNDRVHFNLIYEAA